MKSAFVASFILTLLVSCQEKPNDIELSVMVWNIWEGGSSRLIERDGVPDVIKTIQIADPDIVLLVETYGSGMRIADSLGMHFHLIAPEGTAVDDPGTNLSILSKYPFGRRIDFYNHFNIGGIEVDVDRFGKIRLFDLWLNFQPWHDEPETLDMSPNELVEWEISGGRQEEVQTILQNLTPFLKESDDIPVILGGDFNIWSYRDWGEDTQDLHQGKTVSWWTLAEFEKAGFIDGFRQIHPNAQTHPGISWGMPGIKDDHRIDYILYKGKSIQAIDSEIHKADYNNELIFRGDTIDFPSDHGFVLTKFKLNAKK
ncbi:endonuclease/exonuclease/phosphatase family protein [Belliella marina]|uniref:Endonuclease/exonuclease/phosphatase family protein n=1 Tax=Belliella marina TaxID=1644146 RepID=A0ABW4VTE9_9BACT